MKRIFALFALFSSILQAAPLIIDHTALPLFEQIPDSFLVRAAQIRLLFQHASVGGTIGNGLDCVQGTRNSPAECTLYPDYRYDRRSWVFQPRGNLGWYGKADTFVIAVEGLLDSFDVFSYKYCFLDGIDGVQEPCGSTFSPAATGRAWDYLRLKMDSLALAHPSKTFVWWTIPLTRTGQYCTDTLNGLIRAYTGAHDKVLFDIADIESHDTNNVYQETPEGREMAWPPYCGETGAGGACHPNWLGCVRLAKAFWVMMASLAGWDGGTSVEAPGPRAVPAPILRNVFSAAAFRATAGHARVYDISGREIRVQSITRSGIYFVRRRDGSRVFKVLVLQ